MHEEVSRDYSSIPSHVKQKGKTVKRGQMAEG
jgi:hypothetical protein